MFELNPIDQKKELQEMIIFFVRVRRLSKPDVLMLSKDMRECSEVRVHKQNCKAKSDQPDADP